MIVEAAPKTKTVTWNFCPLCWVAGEALVYVNMRACMQIYGIKQHQGTGWSIGALPLFCPTVEMLLGSPLSPSSCWAPSTGVAPAWN